MTFICKYDSNIRWQQKNETREYALIDITVSNIARKCVSRPHSSTIYFIKLSLQYLNEIIAIILNSLYAFRRQNKNNFRSKTNEKNGSNSLPKEGTSKLILQVVFQNISMHTA